MRRDQASPGHAALCPPMPPAHTTDSPLVSLGYPFLLGMRSRVPRGLRRPDRPALSALAAGLVVCLGSFRFHLAVDTLPFSATVRTQLDRQVFHLLERSTAGQTSQNYGAHLINSHETRVFGIGF